MAHRRRRKRFFSILHQAHGQQGRTYDGIQDLELGRPAGEEYNGWWRAHNSERWRNWWIYLHPTILTEKGAPFAHHHQHSTIIYIQQDAGRRSQKRPSSLSWFVKGTTDHVLGVLRSVCTSPRERGKKWDEKLKKTLYICGRVLGLKWESED